MARRCTSPAGPPPHPITLQVPFTPHSTFEYPGHRRHVNAATCHPPLQQPAAAARWQLSQRARCQRFARAGAPAKLSMRAGRPRQARWRSFAQAGVPAKLCPCRYAAQAQQAHRLRLKKRAGKAQQHSRGALPARIRTKGWQSARVLLSLCQRSSLRPRYPCGGLLHAAAQPIR